MVKVYSSSAIEDMFICTSDSSLYVQNTQPLLIIILKP